MIKVRIKDKWFNNPKVLNTEKEQQLGYQHLELDDIDESNCCLLFVFPEESNNRVFHMRNVLFDIQLYALDKNKKLIDTFPMSYNDNMEVNYPIKGPCMYVVEVPLKILNDCCLDCSLHHP